MRITNNKLFKMENQYLIAIAVSDINAIIGAAGPQYMQRLTSFYTKTSENMRHVFTAMQAATSQYLIESVDFWHHASVMMPKMRQSPQHCARNK
jgi:hypothetical protein